MFSVSNDGVKMVESRMADSLLEAVELFGLKPFRYPKDFGKDTSLNEALKTVCSFYGVGAGADTTAAGNCIYEETSGWMILEIDGHNNIVNSYGCLDNDSKWSIPILAE